MTENICSCDPSRGASRLPLLLQPLPIALALAAALHGGAFAQSTSSDEKTRAPEQLDRVVIESSADASKGGLTKHFAGGQVARGGKVGLLGNQDVMDTPFNTTAYTNELIQNQQARSVGDVLLNDPSVRVARGFGNFQESYFIRGFILNSDSVGYNGLYGLLPRQYISAELFERVEVLRGASAFLNGATPNSDGVGGSINLLPKRAPNQALTQVTLGTASGGQGYAAVDVARRFGPDNATGLRFNAAHREGETAVDQERVNLGMVAVGLDWRSRTVRLSADVGYQDHKLSRTRTNVTLSAAVTSLPAAPDNGTNWAQAWTFSNERDIFGTLRGEIDLSDDWTAWFAAGARSSDEANVLANMTLTDGSTGAGTNSRFDNTREDKVETGEAGIRGALRTGPVKHELVASLSAFKLDKKAAYGTSPSTGPTLIQNNLYAPVAGARQTLTTLGNRMDDPATTGITRLRSAALADTLVMLDDALRVTLGLRHQTMDIRSFAYNTSAPGAPYDRTRTSPMGGVVYKFSQAISAYGNYIEGLTQGATAPSTATASIGTMLDPYVSKQKEVGLKVDGGRIGGALAVFSTEKPRGIVTEAKTFTAQGEDRHRGAELTVFGEPMAGLKLLGGLTWLDAKQVRTGVAATEGKRVIGVPKTMVNLGTEWTVPGVEGLSLDARVTATGSVYANAANTLSVPSWARFDIGARYGVAVGRQWVTLRARVDNVANRNYWASSGGYEGSGYLVLGAPRSVTLSATMEY